MSAICSPECWTPAPCPTTLTDHAPIWWVVLGTEIATHQRGAVTA